MPAAYFDGKPLGGSFGAADNVVIYDDTLIKNGSVGSGYTSRRD